MAEKECKMRDRSFVVRGLAVLLALLIGAPELLMGAVPSPELPNPGTVPGVTREQQIQLGRKAVGEVYKQMPVLPDSSPVTQYVQQLGRRLQQVIPQQYSWPYQFHVIQQKDINAFALPGGPIFVNIGTITAADNEAELAGVMAHEMSHVYMQHSVKAMRKQGMAQGIAGIIGGILGSVIGGTGGALANIGVQSIGGVLSLKYSRADEAQADAVGAIIMYKANYNPIYMAQFFQKLEKMGGAAGPQFLSDHPNPGNRVEAVSNEIRNWPPKSYRNDSPQFVQGKQQAQKVQAYTAQQIADMAKSGQIHNQVPAGVPTAAAPAPTMKNVSVQQVMPSGQFQTYNGPGFSMQYPSNWQVMGGQQNQAGITIAPPSGVSQDSIAYGVIVNVANPQQQMSLDQATQALISQMQQSNPGLSAVGSPQTINVNGNRGMSVDLMGTSPIQGSNGQAQKEHDWLVDFQRSDGSILYIVFVAPEQDFGKLRPTYQKMLQSLRMS